MISIRNLNYAYPDGNRALTDIHLDIHEGECVGIVGCNGAGKSTLLLHLNGLLRGRGEIRIADLDMTDQNTPRIRSLVGLVFQDPEDQLFMPTVREDIAFGPIHMGKSASEIEDSVRRALVEVDMPHFEARSSHHLSLGEKKRIALATVLAMNPSILALDEPSSNLDPKHRRELVQLLQRLKMTRIIASHDLDLVSRLCTRAVWMEEGRIVADGGIEEVLARFSERC
ncbi:MAG: Energy-coupling factor transporter ATP-binding protein EcfA3 [Syntrophaceae bacterium PtaU1.Bin231]|nr:MAG: Energy-coupling factor transporter ATP-binding protein EcfA3 [Syntrophaceae bacterium PtaU1.Bin231]